MTEDPFMIIKAETRVQISLTGIDHTACKESEYEQKENNSALD
jgi:hypothetical protein